MSRIKGWIHTIHTGTKVLCDVAGNESVFVEEIPSNAIRGETVVKLMPGKIFRQQIAVIKLPLHLTGKKVSYIIIPEED